MVPSNVALESKLRRAVEEVYADNLDSLTVRFIRDKVESELDLDAGYFTTPAWKDKSKTIIKEWAVSVFFIHFPGIITPALKLQYCCDSCSNSPLNL